jgi:hypothetical protein
MAPALKALVAGFKTQRQASGNMIPLRFKFNTLITLTHPRQTLAAAVVVAVVAVVAAVVVILRQQTLMATAYPTAKTNFQMTQRTPLLLAAMGNMR